MPEKHTNMIESLEHTPLEELWVEDLSEADYKPFKDFNFTDKSLEEYGFVPYSKMKEAMNKGETTIIINDTEVDIWATIQMWKNVNGAATGI